MLVNRIFHDGLLGLQSSSRNEDDSYNSEAAGRSFVLQHIHIIQPHPFRQAHAHTHSHTHPHTLLECEFLCGSG